VVHGCITTKSSTSATIDTWVMLAKLLSLKREAKKMTMSSE
jgi:hypothetical protein